jgi:hypothetical protein
MHGICMPGYPLSVAWPLQGTEMELRADVKEFKERCRKKEKTAHRKERENPRSSTSGGFRCVA